MVEKVLEFYKTNAKKGERLGMMAREATSCRLNLGWAALVLPIPA